MAAIRRGKKVYFLRKNSRRQRGPRKNVTRQRKLPIHKKKNVCVIRFPKNSYLRTCPLVAWYFNRRIRNNTLSFRRSKSFGWLNGGYHSYKMALHQGRQKKSPCVGCACPDFLKAALKEVASKKRAKWVVAPTKRRRRYSEDETFYRLADTLGEEGGSGLDTDAGTSGTVARPQALSQPLANEPQPVSS